MANSERPPHHTGQAALPDSGTGRSHATASLVDVVQRPQLAATIPAAEVPSLLGELEAVRVRLLARMLRHLVEPPQPEATADDHLLTPAATAKQLGVTVKWLYRNHHRLPFTRQLSRKAIRFSSLGVERWLAQQHGRQGSGLSKMKS
jgi:predicted DNA-binding transcriptional regulator AlpA